MIQCNLRQPAPRQCILERRITAIAHVDDQGLPNKADVGVAHNRQAFSGCNPRRRSPGQLNLELGVFVWRETRPESRRGFSPLNPATHERGASVGSEAHAQVMRDCVFDGWDGLDEERGHGRCNAFRS